MALTTSVETLDDNKVRLHVAIPAADFEPAIDAAFRKLAHEVRVPGFRPGKAPRRLLEAQFGTEVAREQALRDSLPDFYVDAITAESLDVIAPPELDITAGEDDGDVEFDAVVEVRPQVAVEGYDSLQVEVPSPAVSDETIDDQVEQLRARFADVEDSDRPLIDGDYGEVDISGTVDGERDDALSVSDYLYEVGSELVVAELDEALRGAKPGDILEFDAELPERFGDREGEQISFRVLVKETKRRVLPDLTDEWAAEASEFDTLDALREDIRKRLEAYSRVQAQLLARDKVIDAAGDLVTIELPSVLVDQEVERRLHDMQHRLEEQSAGLTITQYLALTGQDQEEFLATLRETGSKAVRADLALRHVVAAESLEATDEEVDREIERIAEEIGQKVPRVRKDLERRGAIEAVRSDLGRTKALAFIVEHATVVDEAGTTLDLTTDFAPLAEASPTDEPIGGAEPTEPTEIADTEDTASAEEAEEPAS